MVPLGKRDLSQERRRMNIRLSKAILTSRPCGILWLVAATFVVGCGPTAPVDERRTTVSGTVTFDGKPLPAGTITFESTESPLATSATIHNGAYSTSRAAIGPNEVGVETASLQFGYPAGYVKIPEKYAVPMTSGLTADVKPGKNENVNFELKSAP
jgi:hypothetical protein